MIHRFRHLATTLLLLASTAAWADEPPAAAPATHPGAVSIGFASQGTLLARRSRQTVAVSTLNVDSIGLSILHVGEGDVLKVLEQGPAAPLPPSAQPVFQHDFPALDGKGGPARPGQPGTTPVDVLHLLPSLQTGLYFVTAKPLPAGTPATMWLMVSNLGLEALTGADGIAAQVRLLSETSVAPGVDVALIARNNREIARVRTDADGIARFAQDQVSGKGDDAPAALYAYGADGEFTAMRLDDAGLLFPPVAAQAASTLAWIMTDRADYKPGEAIHGLSLVRDGAGRKPAGAETAQLLDGNGTLLGESPVTIDDAGLASFTLQAPEAHGARLAIRIANDGQPLAGSDSIGIDSPPAARPADAATPEIPPAIVISPGRRTFQPGEAANVSVQPPADSDVTLAVIDDRIHAIVHQHIGKEGAVVQLPIPADAMGGVYVLATAFTPADEASGKPVQRTYGLQWLDVDQGAKRMGVRLDAPETALAGKPAVVKVALPDLPQKTGAFAIVGTDGSAPSGIDPIAYFFGRRPAAIGLHDDYADVIGAAAQPALPDIAPLMATSTATPQAALLWSAPQPGDATPVSVDLTMPQDDRTRTLRLSIIAASPDKIGFSETGITVKGEKPAKASSRSAPGPKAHATTIKPDGTLALKPGQAALVSAMPVLAPPAWVGPQGQTGIALPAAETWPLQSDITTADADTLLYDLTVAQSLDLAPAALVKRVAALVQGQTLSSDQDYVALFALYGGRPLPLWAQDWLSSAAKPSTTPGWLARYGLTHDDADARAVPAPPRDDDTEDETPMRPLILQTLLAQQIGGAALKANDAGNITGLARSAQDFATLDPRVQLGLRAIEASALNGHPALAEWAAPPDVEGLSKSGIVRAGNTPLHLASKDKRTLHALILSDWPDTAPQ